MDEERFNKELESEQKLVFYNFINRINEVLTSGSPDDVSKIIFSYVMWNDSINKIKKK